MFVGGTSVTTRGLGRTGTSPLGTGATPAGCWQGTGVRGCCYPANGGPEQQMTSTSSFRRHPSKLLCELG